MEYKTKIIDGEEFLLVPKPKRKILNDKYKVRFQQSYVKKYFEVGVFSLFKKFDNSNTVVDTWTTIRRTEKENGEFYWTEWSTGGVNANKEISLLLESWYQKYLAQS